jgi:uncharacterized membrane protein
MNIDTLLLDWLRLGLRWLHVVAAIVWIGTAFYVTGLDRELRRRQGGEAWQVHGGGFYRIRGVTPGDAPPPASGFTRFYWPAYTTWASGFLLLVALYYAEPTLRLADAGAAVLSPGWAIGLSIGSLIVGYTLYEALCRTPLARDARLLGGAVFLLLVGFAWLHAQLFGGRAALLHDGALAGTIMVANVAHIMIPGQRRAIAAWREGRVLDPVWAERARERALHNDLLILPTVLAMLAAHVPWVDAGGRSWLLFAGALLVGGGLRLRNGHLTRFGPAAASGSGPRRDPR